MLFFFCSFLETAILHLTLRIVASNVARAVAELPDLAGKVFLVMEVERGKM